MAPPFQGLASLTIGELGMGIMLMRESDLRVEGLADCFADYFRTNVMPAEVRTLYTRMIERHLITPEAEVGDRRRIFVTPVGHDLFLNAFTGLIRLVDEGHGALEISLLFSLATRRLSNEDD